MQMVESLKNLRKKGVKMQYGGVAEKKKNQRYA